MTDKTNWTSIVIIGLVALLVLLVILSVLPFGWAGGWGAWGMMGRMMGPGVMRPWGFGFFGWLFALLGLLVPLGLLIVVVLGIVWLVRQVGSISTTRTQSACPSCGRPVQAEWRLCPYCGQALEPTEGTYNRETS